jgi:hypothetical protein
VEKIDASEWPSVRPGHVYRFAAIVDNGSGMHPIGAILVPQRIRLNDVLQDAWVVSLDGQPAEDFRILSTTVANNFLHQAHSLGIPISYTPKDELIAKLTNL